MTTFSTEARSHARLLAAILLPVVALALITLARDQARRHEEMGAHLSQRAAEQANGVVQRLLLASAALELIASRPVPEAQVQSVAGNPLAPYFSAIGPADSAPVLAVPPLSGAARARLGNSRSVMALGAEGSGAVRVMLLHDSPGSDAPRRPLVAVLNPAYVWGAAGDPAVAAGLRVFSADGRQLHGPLSGADGPASRADPGRSLSATGTLEWDDADGGQLAAYHRLALAELFAGPDWTVVVSHRAPQPLGDAVTAGAFALALLLAVLSTVWLHRRTRRSSESPDLPEQHGPHRANASADGTAATRSTARPLRRPPVDTLAALGEIDKAILARVGIDRIVETVMHQAAAVLDCNLVAVSSLERDSPSGVRTLSHIGNRRVVVHRSVMPPALAAKLAGRPTGIWIEDPGVCPFLSNLAAAGAQRPLLLPVYCDSRLTAVLSLARVHPPLGDDALAPAQQFASRLGVAFTAATRAEEAHFLGHFDSMTALPNRRHFRERLSQEISRANREQGSLALLYIDLDHFKRVNDSAGHHAGDLILKEAAGRLRRHLREEDLLAHFGGDEFVLLMPTISKATDAGRVAEKLIALLAQPFDVEGGEHHLSASIGVGLYPNDGRAADTLLRNTDTAMTRAKKAGRSRYHFVEERINAELAQQFALESELRRALAQQEFVLFYQPQVDLRSGRIVGAEALIRWQHPKRGLLPPAAFIGIAEEAGLIGRIGEYTRRVACTQVRTWETNGFVLERISVNLSGRELKCPEFMPTLEATLTQSGVRPFVLEIEITESTLVDDSERVLAALEAMRERGIRIAIDDFGTGYSSLGYLKRIPFDVLKVDRSFIVDIGTATDATSRAVASAVLGIAHGLGKEVCAEGVETEGQRAYLAERGCELIQGYLISRPLPANEFEAFARKWAAGRSDPSFPVDRAALTAA